MIRRGGVTDIPWVFFCFVFAAVGNKVSHVSSTLHRLVNVARCKCGLAISQLRVLASHKTNFESVAQGA